jgi:hypothetical protein
MRDTWLYSDDPGKRGNPKKSSTTIQPSDHISIAEEYLLNDQAQNATKQPINDLRKTEKDLRRSVEARLDVSVDSLPLIASGTEVNDFDNRALETGTGQQLIALSKRTVYFFKRMFSGFRSQCIKRALLSRVKPFNNCCANTRTRVVLSPRN